MRKARLNDRQRIMRGIAVWTLGLAVLFASPAVRSAERPPIPVLTYCACTCWYSGPGGKTVTRGMMFTTDKSCSIYRGQTCYCDDQACYLEYKTAVRYKGALYDCKSTSPLKQAEPPAPVPPSRATPPPVGPLQKQP